MHDLHRYPMDVGIRAGSGKGKGVNFTVFDILLHIFSFHIQFGLFDFSSF